MSNLKAAREAIESELQHVEEGIEFYQMRAEALRLALEQLSSAEGAEPTSKPKARKTTGKKASGAKRGRKPKGAGTGNELPSTPSEYWMQFITEEPRSAVEIANAAIAALGFSPNQEQAKKMKQRAAPALTALLSSKQIKDTGAGRQRRFFLAPGKAPASGKQAAKAKGTPVNSTSTALH